MNSILKICVIVLFTFSLLFTNRASDLEEITIIGTVDGNLHGVDRFTNQVLWTTGNDSPMLGTTLNNQYRIDHDLSNEDRFISTHDNI